MIRIEPTIDPPVTEAPQASGFQSTTLSESDLFSLSAVAHQSGVRVTETTAMRVAAVYACSSLIAGVIGTLPWRVYRTTADGDEILVPDHPLTRVLNDEPDPAMPGPVFWESAVHRVLLRGNSISRIYRRPTRGDYRIERLEPMPQVERASAKDRDTGRLSYQLHDIDQPVLNVDQDDVLHFSNFAWNRYGALSTLESGGFNAFGNSLAADDHSARTFKEGVLSNLAVEYPHHVGAEQQELLKDFFTRRQSSGSQMPLVISEDGKIKNLGIKPSDMQLIESRNYNVEDVCRVFGVPPVLIGSGGKNVSAWGSGIYEIIQGFVRFTISRHVRRFESEINRKLLRDPSLRVQADMSELLRSSPRDRGDIYRAALGGNQVPGWMTVNEVRRGERLSPVEGGNDLYKPLTGETDEGISAPDREV